MNELILAGYPFKLFCEEAFPEEFVVHEMVEAYMQLSMHYSDEVIHTGIISSKSLDIFKLGIFGRICELEEDYLCFNFTEETNKIIRCMHKDSGNNLEATLALWEEFEYQHMGFLGFPVEAEYERMFKRDISTALNMQHVFFLDSDIDYDSMRWFAQRYKEEDPAGPFTKEGVERIFKNIPVVRVW